MLKNVFLLLACYWIEGTSLAATITVELDGSGNYTQIQPALDAAASGDTVLIGPGEFTELIPSYIPGYAWDVEVCAYVHVPNLTIIGVGAGQTILGPISYPGDSIQFSPKCMVWLEGNERIIEGITFRNCYDGIHVTNGPVFIDSCEFLNNAGYGIIWHTEDSGGWIRNSQFSSNFIGNYGLGTLGLGSNVIVENCIFDGCDISIKHFQGISFLNCEMFNTQVGIQFSGGALGVLDNCKIYNCSIIGVALSPVEPHCQIENCEISGDIIAVKVEAGGTLSVSNSILTGGSNSTMYLQNSGLVEVHNSHIFKTGTYSIYCSQPKEYGLNIHDMTGNFWGTTDPELVASWIWDQNDDPANFSIVNYLPMADGPVPTEEKSFGSIKAMFR